MEASVAPNFRYYFAAESPVTSIVSKMLARNIEMLDEIPVIENQLSEIMEEQNLLSKEIDDLNCALLHCGNELQVLAQEIVRGQEKVHEMIKIFKLTRQDFLDRVNLLSNSSNATIEECSKLAEFIEVPRKSDASCQTHFEDVDEDELLKLQMEFSERHAIAKQARSYSHRTHRSHSHTVAYVFDESVIPDMSEQKIKPTTRIAETSANESDTELETEIPDRPHWMSELIYRYSTAAVPFPEIVSCTGCNQELKARKVRGSTFLELNGLVHCVEKCPQFKATGGIFNCFKCGLKYINKTEFDLHVYASHDETPPKPEWMTLKIYEDSYIKFKANTRINCPGCGLEFEAQRRGRQVIPSYYLYLHSIESCVETELEGLIKTCGKCGKQFMRDYGFSAHQRNNCDAKFNMKF